MDPESVVEDGYLDILLASPECTFHSRARGGRPIHDQGRMAPWSIFNWLTKLDVQRVLIENVPEFVEWGPLKNGRPDKTNKGRFFESWFMAFQTNGYHAEWRMLNAADYGDATTRTRFFLLARKDGQPITWPEPTHAKQDFPLFPGLKPWRGAKEIINWDNPGRSLFDDPKYQKKPLSEKTRLRIARGLERFGGPLAPLYIRLLNLPDYKPKNQSGNRQTPFVVSQQTGATPRSTDNPIPTITTDGAMRLFQAEGEPFVQANRNNNAPKSIDDPIPTATSASGGGSFLLQPAIIRYNGQSDAEDIEEPLSTVLTNNKHGLAKPMLVQYYNTGTVTSIEVPVPTITTKGRHGLATPILVDANHGNGRNLNGDNHRTHSIDEPLRTITTKRGIGLAEPLIIQTGQTGGNGSYSRAVDDPIATLTTHCDMKLVQPDAYLVPNFGEREDQEPRTHSVEEPLPTITSRGAGNLISPEMESAVQERLAEENIDPRRLVFIDGKPFLLDIKYRMLQNPELARAMGFSDEESQYEFVGNVSQVTKQIGNAVPVNLAAALVKSALQ